MPFAHLADVTLHYQFDGPEDAPVLLLSHSLGLDLTMWEPQLAPLSRELRVLRYDTRGHGLSTTPGGDYSFADLGKDVLGLLDALEIEQAHFCGISLGGAAALWLGVHAGHRFHSLIPTATAACIGTPEGWEARMLQVQEEGIAGIVEGTLERWFTPAFRAARPEVVSATRQQLLATPQGGYTGCCAALRDFDMTAAVGSIALPTLVISGSDDSVTPPAGGRFLAHQIADARMQTLNTAHLVSVEDAAGFNAAVLDFIVSS